MTPEISLVIPVCNEAKSLTALAAEIAAATSPLRKKTEIIYVDDGSSDASWSIILKQSQSNPLCRGIRFRRNFGKSAALDAGFRAARAPIVFTLDADLQDDPSEIPRFLEALKTADVVSGWKKIRQDPWHKVIPSRIFNAMVSRITGVKLHDHNCGFKVYRADVLREVRLYGEMHRFVPVLAAARGYRVTEIVIHHRPRLFGHSHYGVRRFIKGFLDLLTVKFLTTYGSRPQHLLCSTAIALFLTSASGLAATLAARLLDCQHWSLTWIAVGFTMLFGLSCCTFLAGLLAELIVSRSPRTDEQASIAETTP